MRTCVNLGIVFQRNASKYYGHLIRINQTAIMANDAII